MGQVNRRDWREVCRLNLCQFKRLVGMVFMSLRPTFNLNRKVVFMDLESFLVKVSEMYQYNLEQYPEENPTMTGACFEVLEELERSNNA